MEFTFARVYNCHIVNEIPQWHEAPQTQITSLAVVVALPNRQQIDTQIDVLNYID